MSIRPVICAFLAAVVVAGCQSTLDVSSEPNLIHTTDTAPPGAAPGTCWGKDISPAVLETVTEQIILQPAEILDDGTVVEPAVYKTETRQAIVKERKITWFETPCADVMTPDFIASVQRALKARGLYRGTISGDMNGRTRAAIRKYQKSEGLDSGILSLATARQLGLVAVMRKGAETSQPGAGDTPATTQTTAAAKREKTAATEAERARMAKEDRARRKAQRAAALEAEQAARAAEQATRAEQARRDAAEAEARRAEQARREAEEAKARRAEQARREAEEAEARRAEQDRREAEQAEARRAAEAARTEKAKRQAEVDAAIEAEKRAKKTKRVPLPISTESE